MSVTDFVEDILEKLSLLSPTPVDPFPSAYSLSLDTTNASFNACENTAATDPATKDLCGSVVDLTGNPASPLYAGNNDNDMVYVGSLVKLYAMYVAFELQSRVEKQAKKMIAQGLSTSTAGWENKVYNQLKKAWQPKLNAAFPGLPSGMPQFATIFTLSSTGDANFTEQSPPLSDAELDAIGETGTPKGKYRDWMRLMLRWSNNTAASRCILPLSYPYLNGVLAAAGFFDSTAHKGLWISGDDLGNDWIPGPGNKAGQPLTARFATAQGRTKSNFTGTSLQVARLLTLLAQGKLVDSASCTDMISIMQGAQGIGSYIQSALLNASPARPISAIASKIGFGDDKFSHDGALIGVDRAADPANPLQFVEVVLGSPPSKGRTDLRQLAVAYYDCITAQHP